jgi:hypothetical protein
MIIQASVIIWRTVDATSTGVTKRHMPSLKKFPPVTGLHYSMSVTTRGVPYAITHTIVLQAIHFSLIPGNTRR